MHRAPARLGILLALLALTALVPAAASAGTAVSDDRALRRDLGQLLVGRVTGTRPSASLVRRVRAGQLGGVILFADNARTRAQVRGLVAALQAAARAGGHPPLLVAVDQEGGLVRRLPWAPPTLSAAAMGASADPRATALAQARRTARELAADGVNLDLAPVADVPSVTPSFLATRAFGRDPERVAAGACGFADGLAEGGRVAATLKHFPGLGAASANTDFARVTIGAPLTRLRAGYRPYERCADGPRRLVMIASAGYRALGGATPAVLAPVTYRRELARLGFTGATISDDLEAAALRGRRDVEVRAARAGLDLQLHASTEAGSATAFARLLAAARTGSLPRSRVAASAQRVARLKRELGLLPPA